MAFPSWRLLAAVLIVGVSNVPPSFAQVLSVIFPNGELAPGLPGGKRPVAQRRIFLSL